MRAATAGFVGFGEVNSPRTLIEEKCRRAADEVGKQGVGLVTTAPVSDDAQGADVARAIEALKKDDFDVLIACVAGWIPSHAVISVLEEFRGKPIVLWGLSGYYEAGKLITTADQAGTSALRGVLADLGYTFRYVYDTPGASSKASKVACVVRAAAAAAQLRHARIGMVGYRDMRLYGTMFDGVGLKRTLGVEVEFIEMLEIVRNMEASETTEIEDIAADMKSQWSFQKPAPDDLLRKGASYYLSLRSKVEERGFDAMSLIDVDGMKKLEGFPPAMVFMLLADRLGLCTIPENDSLGAVTQLIVKYLTGQIGAYLEFYEFFEDRLLAGVPDYVPSEIVDGRVTVLPASFGSFSQGVLNVSRLKTGRVTLCRLFTKDGRYCVHAVTGEAVTPRPWAEAGWADPAPQLPGLEIITDTPTEEFAQRVMSQHYIIAYGDIHELLEEFCALAHIDLVA